MVGVRDSYGMEVWACQHQHLVPSILHQLLYGYCTCLQLANGGLSVSNHKFHLLASENGRASSRTKIQSSTLFLIIAFNSHYNLHYITFNSTWLSLSFIFRMDKGAWRSSYTSYSLDISLILMFHFVNLLKPTLTTSFIFNVKHMKLTFRTCT